MNKKILLSFTLITSFILCACGAKTSDDASMLQSVSTIDNTSSKNVDSSKDTAIHVTNISFDRNEIELSLGNTAYLNVTIEPSNATNKNYTWSTSDKNVASVDTMGLGIITANGYGEATITATSQDGGLTANCRIIVKQVSVESVSLNYSNATIEEGKTGRLRVTISPSNATNQNVSWSSSEPSVASIDSSGLITAIKPGLTVITVTTEDGGFTASCNLQVREKEKFSYEIGDSVVEVFDTGNSYIGNYIRVYTPITNNGNVNIYISSCSYDIEDSNGNIVKTMSYVNAMPDLIKPGETTYVFEETSYDGSITTGLVAVPHFTIKNASKTEAIRYDVSQISITTDSIYGFEFVGRMTNNTNKTSSIAYVAITVFDKSGNFYATFSDTVFDDVQPGESIGFEATFLTNKYHPSFTQDSIGSYTAVAYEMQIVY